MLFRLLAITQAAKYIGVKEQPPYSNRGPLIDQWQRNTNGIVGYPWCAAFLYCMFLGAGIDLRSKMGLMGPSFVQNWVNWAKQRGYVVRRPFRGDVVCFDWNEDQTRDHIGIVERVLALRWSGGVFVGLVRTIEGNTGAGNDSNGGQVQRRWRWVNKSTVFIRIPGR